MARAEKKIRRKATMNSSAIEAMLKWARKRFKQRMNKPLAKHAGETYKWK